MAPPFAACPNVWAVGVVDFVDFVGVVDEAEAEGGGAEMGK